jgi:hypothetical protein
LTRGIAFAREIFLGAAPLLASRIQAHLG